MREWLSAPEIAALALPGLPGTPRGVLDLAGREGWTSSPAFCRPREARGGGLEFHVSCLSAGVRSAYAATVIAAADVPEDIARAVAAEPAALGLGAVAAEARDARLALVAAADAYARDLRVPRQVADAAYAALYNADCVPAAEWVRKAAPQIAERTLRRWRDALRKGDAARLAFDRGAARRGRGALDAAEGGEVRAYILGLIAARPHLTADHLRTLVADKFPSLSLPHVRTFQRCVDRWRAEHRVALAAITNPDQFKSSLRVSGRNSHPVARLNELWMIDASPADVLTVEGRVSVYVAIDVWSRRVIIAVTRTPRADAVGLLMRRAILAWGVPERVKTDNGSDFRAVATQRLFAALGIETETAAPFSPEQKGHVERAIGTLQRDLMPLLPGFIGHSVADRKVIEARRTFAQRLGETPENAYCVELTLADLQSACDRWASDRYAHRPHDGLGGQTPFARAASFVGAVRRIDDERALDMLLAPAAGKDGYRRVTKHGIRIDGAHYITPDVLPGADVFVRMDPADAGRAYLFSRDGAKFLGVATCPEIAGVDPSALVAEAKRRHKALVADATASIRASMRRIGKRDLVDGVLRQAAKDAGKLIELPRRSTPHATPEIEAARAALDATPAAPIDAATMAQVERDLAADRLSSTVTTLADRVEQRIAGAQGAPSGATPLRRHATREQRFRHALDLRARIAAGEEMSADELVWLGGYERSAEHKAMRDLVDDYGDQALR